MVELKNKLKALSAESQQQAEELAVWRLASQTAPIFDLQDETSILSQPQAVQEKHQEGRTSSAHSACANLTVVREDELLLSCSSHKLRGHVVFSRYWSHAGSSSRRRRSSRLLTLCSFLFFSLHGPRLQQSNTSQPPEESTELQGNNWDGAKFDKVTSLFRSLRLCLWFPHLSPFISISRP